MPLFLPSETEDGEGESQALNRADIPAAESPPVVPGASHAVYEPAELPSGFGRGWHALLKRHPVLEARSLAFPRRSLSVLEGTSTPEREVTCLYVMQGEWGMVRPGEGFDYVASDEATTCHMVGLRNPITRAVALCHIDHPHRVRELHHMVESVGEGAGGAPLELHLVGGYEELAANELTAELLRFFATSPQAFDLRVACVSATNTRIERGLVQPVCRSLGLRCEDGEAFTGVLPRAFRGPGRDYRQARIFSTAEPRICPVIADVTAMEVVVQPFPTR
jgi:hypothetical protein